MAVKVMLAPSLVKTAPQPAAEVREAAPAAAPAAARAEAKPKRRRSSVYDADGNEVFITLMCLKCKKMRPLSLFGLRRMADGAIRNQPWCRSCRSGTGEGARRRRAEAPEAAAEVAVAAEPAAVDAGNLAAQVSAALSAGRR